MNLMAKTKNILNYNQLKSLSKKSGLINNDGPYLMKSTQFLKQLIRPSTNSEITLFKMSSKFFLFRELVFVRVKTKQGLSFESKVLKGSFNSFKNIKQLEKEFSKLDFLVRKNSLEIDSFEIIHTHPSGCYLEHSRGNQILSLGGISKSDVDVANYFYEKFKNYVSLKAICPGNITFCSA